MATEREETAGSKHFDCPECGAGFWAHCGSDMPSWCPWCGATPSEKVRDE